MKSVDIKKLRGYLGLDQGMLARLLSTSTTQVSRWETKDVSRSKLFDQVLLVINATKEKLKDSIEDDLLTKGNMYVLYKAMRIVAKDYGWEE